MVITIPEKRLYFRIFYYKSYYYLKNDYISGYLITEATTS